MVPEATAKATKASDETPLMRGAEAEPHFAWRLEGRAAGLQVDGDVGVGEGPQDAGAKEPEANEEGPAAVELHGSLDMVGWAAA